MFESVSTRTDGWTDGLQFESHPISPLCETWTQVSEKTKTFIYKFLDTLELLRDVLDKAWEHIYVVACFPFYIR